MWAPQGVEYLLLLKFDYKESNSMLIPLVVEYGFPTALGSLSELKHQIAVYIYKESYF
jgi:hypothetical protein